MERYPVCAGKETDQAGCAVAHRRHPAQRGDINHLRLNAHQETDRHPASCRPNGRGSGHCVRHLWHVLLPPLSGAILDSRNKPAKQSPDHFKRILWLGTASHLCLHRPGLLRRRFGFFVLVKQPGPGSNNYPCLYSQNSR